MPPDPSRYSRKPPLPRLIVSWIIYATMRLIVLLPYQWQLRLGRAFGRLLGVLIRGRRWVARRNIEVCFPELSEKEQSDLLKAHFEAFGACLVERAMGWFGPMHKIRHLVDMHGAEYIGDALSKGNGIIFYSTHFTTTELFFPLLSELCPRFCLMYKTQKNAVMDEKIHTARLRSIDQLIRKEDVRTMFRELAANSAVFYASDQSYAGKGAALMPFFAEPAMTNTAISRLARRSGAVVLPAVCRYIPESGRYEMIIMAPLDNLPSDDAVEDTRRLNAILEDYIRLCPEQYWWIHQRFKGRPPEYPDIYAREPRG